MAENLSRSTGDGFDKDALRSSVKTINAAKAKASELNGEAGAATKNAAEQYNFDKTALTFVAKLARKEPADAQAIIAAVVTYGHAMGFFDTSDMFQDHIHAMRAVVTAVDDGKAGKSVSNVRKLGSKATEQAPATH